MTVPRSNPDNPDSGKTSPAPSAEKTPPGKAEGTPTEDIELGDWDDDIKFGSRTWWKPIIKTSEVEIAPLMGRAKEDENDAEAPLETGEADPALQSSGTENPESHSEMRHFKSNRPVPNDELLPWTQRQEKTGSDRRPEGRANQTTGTEHDPHTDEVAEGGEDLQGEDWLETELDQLANAQHVEEVGGPIDWWLTRVPR